MKKILFIATVVRTHINTFHLPYIKMFKEHGYKTVVAAKNDYDGGNFDIPNCDLYIDVPFSRNPFSISNVKAYRMLKKLIENSGFDIVQCNTPVGSVVGRLAARKARKRGTKVVYIAHGFHFFKGSPVLNWLIFYPVEKALSHITDILVTINHEDYECAKKFSAKKTVYINGIGVELGEIDHCEGNRKKLLQQLGLEEENILIASVGELIRRKNHEMAIKSIAMIDNPKVHYVIVGSGELDSELKELTNHLNIAERVHFMGFRNDVFEILKASDVFFFPSYQEGLPVAVMEAMASGLPIVASKIRGVTDLIVSDKGGFLYAPNDGQGFAEGIEKLINNPILRKEMGRFNKEYIQKYDIEIVKEKFSKLYFPNEKKTLEAQKIQGQC